MSHGLEKYKALLCRGALLANSGQDAAEVTAEEAKILNEEDLSVHTTVRG